MLLSIIIPVYNVEQFIEECLDSVCTQSFADWEAICVNDGSTDCSLSLLQEFASRDSRIHVISHSNAGLSTARNTGLKAASGEYVLFLDSDDKLSNNDALQHLVDSIEGDYDMICFSGRRFLDGTNKYLPADELIPATYTSGMEYFDKNFMVVRNFPFVCVVLRAYRRNFLLDNNIWFEDGIYHEDNRFTPIVCYYASMVKVINHCVYDYRYREGSITTTKVNPKRADDLLDTLTANAAGCVGMAANMIGVHKRIICFDDNGKYMTMFNPEIIKKSEPYETEEGCLSLLGGPRKCKRYKSIKVQWQTAEFQTRIKTFTGWTAQIIQHEIDHCDGILI